MPYHSQGIGQHHRPIDAMLCVWCHSFGALRIDRVARAIELFPEPRQPPKETHDHSHYTTQQSGNRQQCDSSVSYGSEAVITIDRDARPRRMRFSLGHELGHRIQDKGVIATACPAVTLAHIDFQPPQVKHEANGFAAQILLPTYILDPLADTKPFTFATGAPLANRVQASVTATALKMVMSGHHLGMVVCHSDGRLQWAARGPDLPWQLRPVELLDDDSVAHDLWKGRDGTGRPMLQSAETWIDCEGAEDYELTEDSRLVAAGTTLSLFWCKDEALIRRFQ
jgi:hypothetical protein